MILRYLGQYWPYLAIVAICVAGWYYRERALDAEALAEARQQVITEKNNQIDQFKSSITNQNEAIIALAERSEEGRVVYLQDYARADEQAKSNDSSAEYYLGLSRQFEGELIECRAAQELIEQEIAQ